MKEFFATAYLKEVLSTHNLSPNRRLGQNFLICSRVFSDLLENAGVSSGDFVVEIGAGLGRLTVMLGERAGKVVSVEIDGGLFKLASKRIAERGNVTLLHKDFLESKHRIDPDISALVRRERKGKPVKVVSNLPYQISSPAIINLLNWEQPVESMYLMLQREVAERLVSGPGRSQYGPLSVFAAYGSHVRLLFKVPASAFWPRPEVSSAVVELRRRKPNIEAVDYTLFSKVVRYLFQNRRKMLRKALKMGWGKSISEKVLEDTEIEGECRVEQLTVERIVAIANALSYILVNR